MPNGNITKKQGETAYASNQRMRNDAEEQSDRLKLVAGFAGARIASKLVGTLVPSLAGIAPIAEIGGGALLIWKGINPKNKNAGLMLGLGLGLGVGMVDRVGDFIVTAAAKFKNK